jgi:hypothetical protein
MMERTEGQHMLLFKEMSMMLVRSYVGQGVSILVCAPEGICQDHLWDVTKVLWID